MDMLSSTAGTHTHTQAHTQNVFKTTTVSLIKVKLQYYIFHWKILRRRKGASAWTLCYTPHLFHFSEKRSRFHFLSHFLSRLCAAQMGITAAPPSTGVTSRAPPASRAIQWCPGSQSFLLPSAWTPASRWRSETSGVTSRPAAKTARPAAEHHPPPGAAAPLHKYKKSVLCSFKSLKVLLCSWHQACVGSRLAPAAPVTHMWGCILIL